MDMVLFAVVLLAGFLACGGTTAQAQAAQGFVSDLVQTIDASTFDPTSPDPSGITYLEASGSLLVSDSKVSELDIFEGVNLSAFD